jgi:hypothetical protein
MFARAYTDPAQRERVNREYAEPDEPEWVRDYFTFIHVN